MPVRKIVIAALLVATYTSTASATSVIDQEQNDASAFMARFSQTDLAQSFQTQQGLPTVGAGIRLQPGEGTSDTVIISLFDALPNAGGTLLAEGSGTGTAGEWFDVQWAGGPVALVPDTTYYLVFHGNTSLGISGSTTNPYPHGHVFANAGFQPFPTFDYAFRTWVAAESVSVLEIPTASEVGLLLMALLLSGAGLWLMRR